MDEDLELIARLRSGDETALAGLYQSLGSKVYSLALHMLESPEDAREVMQDAFVKLYHSAHRFDPERGSLRAYLYTIARNEARMRLRARRARPRALADLDLHAPDMPLEAPHHSDPVDRVLIDGALAQLEPQDTRLLEECFYLGYSHSELAERHELPLGTVKSRIRRALLQLRELLEGA